MRGMVGYCMGGRKHVQYRERGGIGAVRRGKGEEDRRRRRRVRKEIVREERKERRSRDWKRGKGERE